MNAQTLPHSLSIIFAIENEIENELFWTSLNSWQKQSVEIIVVLGDSHDGTYEKLKEFGDDLKVFVMGPSNRAQRYNLGASEATGNWIILNHPRSFLETKSISQLNDVDGSSFVWGAFSHGFDADDWPYRFTSWYSNRVRGDIRNIFYLDHCFFCLKQAFIEVGGFPEIDIFEDTILSKRLKKLSPAKRLPALSLTSSIRFKRNGFWRQAWLNQRMKLRFYFQKDFWKMNQEYEKRLFLNGRRRSTK